MFESILIRQHSDAGSVDAGAIAEALLFYNRVHIVADSTLFVEILQALGPDNLLWLLGRGQLSITYIPESLTVLFDIPRHGRGLQVHSLGMVTSSLDIKLGSNVTFQTSIRKKGRFTNSDAIASDVQRVMGKSRASKHFVKALLDKVSFRHLTTSKELPGGFSAIAEEDLHDAEFTKRAAAQILRTLAPHVTLPSDIRFSLMFIDHTFAIDTNLNFRQLNTRHPEIFHPNFWTNRPSFGYL
jgi:hypothetical protein